MKLGKMLLLLGAIGALAALTIPAGSQAEEEPVYWYVVEGESEVPVEEVESEEEVEEAAGVPFKATGKLTFKMATSGVTTGACTVTVEGKAVNVKGVGAAGAVEKGSVTGGCPTNLPKCSATSGSLGAFDWSINATRAGAVITATFGGSTFGFKYEAFCATYGFPPTGYGFAGVLNGVYNGKACLEYTNSGNLKVEGSNENVTVTGELCLGAGLVLK